MRRRPLAAAALAGAVLTWLLPAPLEAHKPVTSRYAFYPDVQAVLAARCVSCHREDGDAPMPLGSYREARPWAEAIREQVAGGEMPPWFAELAEPALAGHNALSAREIDILVDWATGGAPEGTPPAGDPSPARASAAPAAHGPPGRLVEIELPAASGSRRTLLEPRTETHIAGFEVLPGGDRVVRGAWLLVDGRLRGVWSAGRGPVSWPEGCSLTVPAGSSVELELEDGVSSVRGRRAGTAARLWLLETPPAREVRSYTVEQHGAPTSLPAGSEVLAIVPPAGRLPPLTVGIGCARPPVASLSCRESSSWPLAYALQVPVPVKEGQGCAFVSPTGQRVTILAAVPRAPPAPPGGPPPRR